MGFKGERKKREHKGERRKGTKGGEKDLT